MPSRALLRSLPLPLPLLVLGCTVQVSRPVSVATAPAPGPPRPIPVAVGGSRVIDLQYGGSFCALRQDGRVACWGHNASSSLGDGSNEARSRPALVPGLDHVQRLLGDPPRGFCALRSDRSLWCWGFGYTGDTSLPANGVRPRPVADRVVDFGFAERFPGVCSRRDDGTTACVELRVDQGGGCAQWADEAKTSCLFPRRTVRLVQRRIDDAGQVRFGEAPGRRTCSLERGLVLCQAPDNFEGKLGDPTRERADTPTPVPGLRDMVAVSESGGSSTCAVRSDGVAFCWGRNRDHELVVEPDARPCPAFYPKSGVSCNARPTPLPVAGVAQVLLTAQGMFVLTKAGAVLRSHSTASQSSSGVESSPFELVAGIPPSARLVAGNLVPYATCALSHAGEVYCFGRSADLGDGGLLVSRVPVPISGVRGAVEVEVDSTGVCARLDDGTVNCWGDPDAPRGLRDIVALGKPCALARDGRVWCWGTNSYGEMGLGRRDRPGLAQDREVVHVPLPVPGLRNITAISSSLGTTCALDTKGVVRCWGTWGPRFPTLSPTEIHGLPPAREIWSAGGRQCALARDGQVWCFGTKIAPAPRPELGVTAHLPSHCPGPIHPEADCIVDPAGAVRCAAALAPIRLPRPVKQLSTGQGSGNVNPRMCAQLEDGSLWCWGSPYCADGSTLCVDDGVWSHTEKMLDDVAQVSVGSFVSCAVRIDGTVWCWGLADTGGLGGPYPPADHLVRVELDHLDR